MSGLGADNPMLSMDAALAAFVLKLCLVGTKVYEVYGSLCI